MNAWNIAKPIDWAAMAKSIRHADSIENKLLGFFDINPDEELTVADACAKFEAADRVHMGRLMKSMVERSLLVRHWGGECYVYGRGVA